MLQVEALARSVLRDPLHITVGERNTAQVRPCLLPLMVRRGLCLLRSLPNRWCLWGPATSALTLNPSAHSAVVKLACNDSSRKEEVVRPQA